MKISSQDSIGPNAHQILQQIQVNVTYRRTSEKWKATLWGLLYLKVLDPTECFISNWQKSIRDNTISKREKINSNKNLNRKVHVVQWYPEVNTLFSASPLVLVQNSILRGEQNL